MPRPKGLPKTGGKVKGGKHAATIAKAALHVKSVELTVERVKEEYGRIAFLDIRTLFAEDGNLKPISEWPEDAARAVAGIEVEEASDRHGRIHKVRIINKISALDSIAKHLGMFVDRIAGADGGAIKIESNNPRDILALELAGVAARIAAGRNPEKTDG